MRTRERWAFLAAAVLLVVVLPTLNALPEGSPVRVSNFTLNLFGKFLTYAILALGLDLLWGYAGVLSLGAAWPLGVQFSGHRPVTGPVTDASTFGASRGRRAPAGWHSRRAARSPRRAAPRSPDRHPCRTRRS